MATNKTPTERLDAMSKFFFDEGGIVDQIKALNDSIVPTTDECDKISEALGALYAQYATVRDDARVARNGVEDTDGKVLVEGLIQINDELRDLVEPIKTMEAQARMDAFGLNEVTGKPYTVKQIDDRAVVALAGNGYAEYQKLIARRRVLERQKAGTQAILADCDTALSMYRNRSRALCARLNNLTARLGG